MTAQAEHAGRLFRRRYPDMYTAGGTVHPIRNSPGYDELEDRARTVRRHREDQEEEAHREGSGEEAEGKLEAMREWQEIRRAIMPTGINRGRQTNGRYTYELDAIPPDLYRVDGMGPDLVGERLIPVIGDRAEDMDGGEALSFLRAARRRYQKAVGEGAGHHGARDAGRAFARRRRIMGRAHA